MAEKTTTKSTLKKVLSHIQKYRALLLFSLLLATATAALSLYVPILIGEAIDAITDAGAVRFDVITPILWQIAAVVSGAALAQWIMNMLNNRITYGIVRDLRNEAFARIQKLPLSYTDTHPTGETVSRVITDADQLADGLLMGFTQLFTGVVTIVGTLIFMLTIHAGITAVVFVLTPMSLLLARFIAKKTHRFFRAQSEVRGEQTALIDEMLVNQKLVQAFSEQDHVLARFDEIGGRLEKCSLKAVFFSSLVNPSTRVLNNVIYAAVALTGALTALTGALTVGGLTCFLSYATQYAKPFNEISGVITELQNALACAARLFELIETPTEIPDKADAAVLEDASGEIDIENVHFSYVPDKTLIRDFDLHVTPGQRVAIVGPTGCGKTTVINLLLRFYDVNEGAICADGTDIRSLTRKSLRQNIGMVLQDTWLKSGTVRENIKMGHPAATDEEMIHAAQAAHAHSFIRRLPQGYDTVIGEDGGSLSAGQKQLLCITRVMLCLPPILILDEATSSIDTRTEAKIQAAFTQMMQGRTSFIVAHRLSTIREADVILVMREGNIVEQGQHDELLRLGGFYAELYNSQFAQ